MMTLDEVIKEIKRHNFTMFKALGDEEPSVRLAIEYLHSLGRDEMAEYLTQLAKEGAIRIGPVEGFLCAACEIDGWQYIIMSDFYPDYSSLEEHMLNLVHEIGATTKFTQLPEENEALEVGASKWFEKRIKMITKDSERIKQQQESLPKKIEEKIAAKPSPIQPAEPIQEKIVINKKMDVSKAPEPVVVKPVPEPIKPAMKSKKAVFDEMIHRGLITKDQLQDAKDKQLGAKKPLQELLIEMDFVDEPAMMAVIAEVSGLPLVNLKNEKMDKEIAKLIPYEVNVRHGVFPLREEDGALVLAMSNPQNLMSMDEVRMFADGPVVPVLASPSDITRAIEEGHKADASMFGILSNSAKDDEVEIVSDFDAAEIINDMEKKEGGLARKKKEEVEIPAEFKSLLGEESPTVKLVNLVLSDAVKSRASDIHIEPREAFVEIRYRIDGDLKTILKVPSKFLNQMVVRIKILAELDITEMMKPQDGRIHLMINKKKIDFRISTVPTAYGEKIVIRVLDSSRSKVNLDEVGFNEKEKQMFIEAIKSPQGMVFVTGPTGSGKTSTLYAALNFIKNETINIITLEDPIEFINEGLNQIQVNPARGVTFATGLRSILRQDPNVIFVGEIRDHETADIAVKASLTGHLLLSTLHTNSAIGTIARLIDIGLEHYQIASSVILIVAQRLIKVICPDCKEEYSPDEKFFEKYKSFLEKYNITKFHHGRGCQKCNFSGYFGRRAVFEVMKISERLKNLISAKSSEEILLREAQKDGFCLLMDSGANSVIQGLTTVEEVTKTLGAYEKKSVAQDVIAKGTPSEKIDIPVSEIEDVVNEPVHRDKPLVLAVDDEKDILKILVKYLETAGFAVIKATNGKEAVELAIKDQPDLIITDFMMPVMDGLEEIKILRSRLETATIPIIMLTAKQDKETELQGLDAGADDYITKPYDKDKLISRVKLLLKRKKS